jgi:carboxyl-terminal processing protease
MHKLKKFCLNLLFIVILSTIFVVPANAAEEGYSDYINSVFEMVQDRYYEDVPEEELLKGALRGIFDSMDDYTVFYDLDEADAFFNSVEANYQGIGVELMEVTEGALVTRVFSDSPAEGAGIVANDIIVSVDDKDVQGFSIQDIANLIKGEIGSFVKLGVVRKNSADILVFNIERAVVNISPVTWWVTNDIMYIKLDSFSSKSSNFLKQALEEADNRSIKKIILDLRNNLGGEVGQAVEIARQLVHEGIITTLDFKSEETADVVYKSYNENPKYLTAVLVNNNSASASEILASAIQDSRDGFLVGAQTYGKGVFQNVFPILKPSAYERYKAKYGKDIVDGYEWMQKHDVQIYQADLIGWTKITTGHYLTRNGKMIHGIGLTPDFAVEDYELVAGLDINAIKPLSSSATVELNGVGNDVYNAERILKIKGYEIENIDNILDEKTCDELQKYQHEKGISVTGTLDEETKNHLNVELQQLRIEIDRPYAKAIELLDLLKR